MPIEMLASTDSLYPNTTATFTFGQNVVSHVVGVSYWGFNLDSAQSIQKIALRITSNQVGNVVYARANTVLDGNDHSITSGSFVHLSCVAVTGGNDSNIVLASANGIPGGGQSEPLAIPYPPNIKTAFLAGWSTAIGQGAGASSDISRLGSSVGVVSSGNSASITGRADLFSYGQAGSWYPTVDAGLICTNAYEGGLVVKESGHQQDAHSLNVTMPQEVDAVVVMLQSFDLKMNSSQDSSISNINSGGQHYALQSDKKTVNFDSGICTRGTGSQYTEDGSSSYASIVVFGLPSSS